MGKNNTKHCAWVNKLCIPMFIAAFILFAGIIGAWCSIAHIQRNLNDIQAQINAINTQTSMSIDEFEFLKAEIQNHRSFIEKQEQNLLWLFGALGGAALFLMGFFGFKTQKDVQELVDNVYKSEIIAQLGKKLGDQGLEYLKRSVERERNAQNKRILFAAGSGTDNEQLTELKENLEFFQEQGYKTNDEVRLLDVRNYKKIIKDYDVVVYQVSYQEDSSGTEAENEKNEYKISDEDIWRALIEMLSEQKKTCVLVCLDGIEIDLKYANQYGATTVNFFAKLRETVYSLLYFSPDQED